MYVDRFTRAASSYPTASTTPSDPVGPEHPAGGTSETSFAHYLLVASGGSGDANGTAEWSHGDTNYDVVKPGDTLIGISGHEHLPLSKLYALNGEFDPQRQDGIPHSDRSPHGGWDPDFILPGDHVYLPPKPVKPQPPKPSPKPHVPTRPHKLPTTMPSTTGKPKDHGSPFFKYGFGVEFAGKFGPDQAGSAEPYGKMSFALSSHFNVNIKVKWTPTNKLIVPTARTDPAPKPGEPPKTRMERFKAGWKGRIFPGEKLSVDVGLVVNKQWEGGFSTEIKLGTKAKTAATTARATATTRVGKFFKGIRSRLDYSGYGTKKSPENVLLDTAQGKIGKLHPFKAIRILTAKDPSATAKGLGIDTTAAPGTPPPGRRGLAWKMLTKDGELTLSGEKGWVNPKGHLPAPTVFSNFAAKAKTADVGKALPPGRLAQTGFFVTTVAGTFATDQLVGRHIGLAPVRQLVDGLGGVATGYAVDVTARKAVPFVGSRVVSPAATRAASALRTARSALGPSSVVSAVRGAATRIGLPRVASALRPSSVVSAVRGAATKIGLPRAASALRPVATRLAPVARAAGRLLGIRSGSSLVESAGSVLRVGSKFGRLAGPAGAAIAAVPDVIFAVNSFAHGKVGAGLTSLADGAIRAGTTVAGAAIGQALIPIPGVGAAVGAVVGGFVGDEIVGHQAQIVGAAKAVGHAAVSAGKAVGHAAVSAAKAVASFFGF
jgi:hypothetical protein